jgi:Flp pilus assembly protein TadG
LRARPDDGGSVTAEFAVGLVAVVLVLAVVLVTAVGASARLRCQDAARAAARAAALGESDTVMAEAARHVAGSGATVAVVRDAPWVEVRVSTSVPGGWFTGGAIGLSASATAWVEP